MIERQPRTGIVYENAPSTLPMRRLIPHSLSVAVGEKVFGQGLTPQGHQELKKGLKKILKQEHITPGQDILPIYEDAIKFKVEGEENIPRSGSTLIIGNHEKGSLIGGMVHFIEAARITHEVREDVEDDVIREPRVIFQRGLSRALKLPGGKKLVVMIPFSRQFYQLASDSLNWVMVDPPKFDERGQITNRQNLPRGLIGEFLQGQALFWFPQGKNDKSGEIRMPEKADGFVTKLKDHDVNTIPVVFEKGDGEFHITFGREVHVQDFPRNESGELDVQTFASQHMTPLIRKNRP